MDQDCLVNMAGYWPHSFLASLWTLSPYQSINMQKKKLSKYPVLLYGSVAQGLGTTKFTNLIG